MIRQPTGDGLCNTLIAGVGDIAGLDYYIDILPSDWEDKTWYTVRIEAYDTDLATFIDDRLVFQIEDTDEAMLTGQVVLAVKPGLVVYFDDVRVVALVPG